MRPDPHALCRHALLWAVAISAISCGGQTAPSQVAASGQEPTQMAGSGDAPAQVILLTGPTAQWFLDLDPPPDGRVVVAGGEGGAVFALVLGEDLADAEDQLMSLMIPGEVEGCERGGVTCCDVERKSYVLDSEYEKQRSWLRLGEHCEGGPPEERVVDGPPDEPYPEVIEIDPQIISDLAKLGVTYPFMTLADQDGNGRILEDPSYVDSGLELPLPAIDRSGFREPLSIIPAGHVASSRPRCVDSVGSCKEDHDDLCNGGRRHWFRWNKRKNKWCQLSDKCKC